MLCSFLSAWLHIERVTEGSNHLSHTQEATLGQGQVLTIHFLKVKNKQKIYWYGRDKLQECHMELQFQWNQQVIWIQSDKRNQNREGQYDKSIIRYVKIVIICITTYKTAKKKPERNGISNFLVNVYKNT